MHSSRMRTARPNRDPPDRDPLPGQRPPTWTETSYLERDPLPGQRPPWQRTTWTENSLDRETQTEAPRQRPPWTETPWTETPLDRKPQTETPRTETPLVMWPVVHAGTETPLWTEPQTCVKTSPCHINYKNFPEA